MTEIMSSLIANIISEYAKKIVEKISQGKRITAPELMVLIMSEMDRRLTTQIEALRREFDGKFKGLEDRFKGLEDRMRALELRVDGLEKRMDDLKFYIDQYHRETIERIKTVSYTHLTLPTN